MLVLSRHQYDSVMIDEDIEITVVEIKGNTVKLGVTAPRGRRICRSELYMKLHLPQAAALQSDAETDAN